MPHLSKADREGYSDTYRELYPPVLAFLRRCVPESDVEDVAAEVFAVAWRKWGTIPLDEVRPWLYGVARNLSANGRRADTRHRQLEQQVVGGLRLEEDETSHNDLSIDLRWAWKQLGDRDREVLALVTWDELTGREAAAVQGCTRAAFSVRLTRARRRLRKLVEEFDPAAERERPVGSRSREEQPAWS